LNKIFNFTVPKTDPLNSCIQMEASFSFKVKYLATNQVFYKCQPTITISFLRLFIFLRADHFIERQILQWKT